MTKTHINDTSSMYRVTNMLNHKGFIHWNKNKKYTFWIDNDNMLY